MLECRLQSRRSQAACVGFRRCERFDFGDLLRCSRIIRVLLSIFENMIPNFGIFSVKLWSTGTEHSVSCIEAKANVCCVKFNPESRYHLAFGSAGLWRLYVEVYL